MVAYVQNFATRNKFNLKFKKIFQLYLKMVNFLSSGSNNQKLIHTLKILINFKINAPHIILPCNILILSEKNN